MEYGPGTLAERQEYLVSDIAELEPVTAERIREVAGSEYEP